MITSLTIVVTAVVLLLIAIVTLTTRRQAHARSELGSVSQQWLIGHKADER